MICSSLLALSLGTVAVYDPLAVASGFDPKTQDVSIVDSARNREIPIRVYFPAHRAPSPIVLFSHGLGGSRSGSTFLGKHLARRGYVAVFLQHPGSDESVWKGVPLAQRASALRRAADAKNYILRVEDVKSVIDQLERWERSKTGDWGGWLNTRQIGMSGHSFGAVTTQAISGQSQGALGPRYTDDRVRAAIPYSPSPPSVGSTDVAFRSVKIPWMLMTGTKDNSPISDMTAQKRQSVYPSLPGGIDKFQLVLWEAEHSIFTDGRLPGDDHLANPNHHRAILGLTTAFWDRYLKGDASAGKWLTGRGAKGILEKEDVFQFHLANR